MTNVLKIEVHRHFSLSLEIKSYDEGQLDTLSSTFDGGRLELYIIIIRIIWSNNRRIAIHHFNIWSFYLCACYSVFWILYLLIDGEVNLSICDSSIFLSLQRFFLLVIGVDATFSNWQSSRVKNPFSSSVWNKLTH